MSKSPLRVLLVGCGRIAGGFDQDRSLESLPLSHAGAYTRDSRYELVACVEPNDSQRKNFIRRWSIPYEFCSLNDISLKELNFDVISVCSPTFEHFRDVVNSLPLKPKLIFCEKPISDDLIKTEQLVAACDAEKILLAINYTRRFDPSIHELKNRIQSGGWGSLKSINGIYNKGLFNNGSHMVDLLQFLIGSIHVVKVGRPIFDYFPNDPSIPIWFEGEKGEQIHFACGDARDYSIFELQFIFEDGVLAMEDGGLYWRERGVIDSEFFDGYKVLAEGVRYRGHYEKSMTGALSNIFSAINDSTSLVSNGDTALATQRICEKIRIAVGKQNQ